MWHSRHKRRVKAKGVAGSGAYDVDVRGEIGRRSQSASLGRVLHDLIKDACDSRYAAGKVTNLAGMTDQKREEMARLYGPLSVRVLCPHCSWNARAADPMAKLARHMRQAHPAGTMPESSREENDNAE